MEERNYWIVAPADSSDKLFDDIWNYDLEHGTIAIGWGEMDELHTIDKLEALAQFDEKYPEDMKNIRSKYFNTIWKWYNEIKEGDIVIARKGTKRVVGLGIVSGQAYKDENQALERILIDEPLYPHFLPVDWFMTDEKEYDGIQFSQYVFIKTYLEKLINLGLQSYIPDIAYDETTDNDANGQEQVVSNKSKEFALETIMRDFLKTNFDIVFNNKLELFYDTEDTDPFEYPTEIGKIDILAYDVKTDNPLIIELKRGRASDKVVGQILRYMGWVQENICEENQTVQGLIICKYVDNKLKYAIKQTQNIRIMEYRMDFELIDAFP